MTGPWLSAEHCSGTHAGMQDSTFARDNLRTAECVVVLWLMPLLTRYFEVQDPILNLYVHWIKGMVVGNVRSFEVVALSVLDSVVTDFETRWQDFAVELEDGAVPKAPNVRNDPCISNLLDIIRSLIPVHRLFFHWV